MTAINHFKIGLFFLVSVSIITFGLIWLGTTGYLRDTKSYVTFFSSSVQGLNVGSSVKYLGLQVGKIASMELHSKDKDLVRVVMDLDAGFKLKKDMVVRKAIKGIIGESYLVISRVERSIEEATPKIDFPVDDPLIPSMPGQMQRVQSALASLYQKVEALDVDGLLSQWTQVARQANTIIKGSGIETTLQNVRTAAEDIRLVTRRLERLTAPLSASGSEQQVQGVFKDLAAASQSLKKVTRSLEQQLAQLPPGSAASTVSNLNQTISSVDLSVEKAEVKLSESLQRFQQSLVRLNQVFSEIQALARSLQTEPGRILKQIETREPFEE